MEVRNAWNPRDVKKYETKLLREEFLVQELFVPNQIKLVYSHIDRMIIGGIYPIEGAVRLEAVKGLGSSYFLERREMGIINIGNSGVVEVDGSEYVLMPKEGLYVGKGSRNITFTSENPDRPAKFYFNSTPAHMEYPISKIELNQRQGQRLGSLEESNTRTIYKYIHPDGIQSCQLVMGMTILESGNVWNSMPCHTHDRRMEVYLYFDLPGDEVVFHFMGEPEETRHLVVRNEEAVISPSWSIHCGVGTTNYAFIWGMAGENQEFADMDDVSMTTLK